MTKVDQRIALAREYLAGLTGQPVESLPLIVAQREVAELRHSLGQVLAAIEGQAAPLTDEQHAIVLEALKDAARWRDHKGAGECYLCATDPCGLCYCHAADLNKASDYRRVLHDLGGAS